MFATTCGKLRCSVRVDKMVATLVAVSASWIIGLQVVDDDDHVLNICINWRSDGQLSLVGESDGSGRRHWPWAGRRTVVTITRQSARRTTNPSR